MQDRYKDIVSTKTIKALVGEFLCTFIFLFAVCATGVNEYNAPERSFTVSGLVTLMVSVAIIYAFGPLSGAHFNPAVTVGLMIGGKIDWIVGLLYIFEQLFASVIVVYVIRYIYQQVIKDPIEEILTLSVPDNVSKSSAVLLEAIMTFILVSVIYLVAVDTTRQSSTTSDTESQFQEAPKATTPENTTRRLFAPIAIGCTLGFLCYLGGRISEGAFNPARVTGPALVARKFTDLWVYWIGDLLGAAIAAAMFAHALPRLV